MFHNFCVKKKQQQKTKISRSSKQLLIKLQTNLCSSTVKLKKHTTLEIAKMSLHEIILAQLIHNIMDIKPLWI